jgi:hypothetical protein
VNAVLNGSGKLVMETILETKPVAFCSLSMVYGASCM